MPALAEAGFAVLAPDMRGYGDSDKPDGTTGYDARALAEEFRALVQVIGFGAGAPITLVAHDMGAPPALLWCADHPDEIAGLLYLEEPVLLPDLLSKIIVYTPETAARGSMWWWLLPLAPGATGKAGRRQRARISDLVLRPGSRQSAAPSNPRPSRRPCAPSAAGREYWAPWACIGLRSPPWNKRRN